MTRNALFLLLLNFFTSSRAVNTIDLGQPVHEMRIGSSMMFLQDETRSMIAHEALDQLDSFVGEDSPIPRFGYTSNAIWGVLYLENTSSERREYYFEDEDPFHHTIDVFLYDGDVLIKEFQAGLKAEVKKREISHHNWVMPFDLEPGQKCMLLTRVSMGGAAVRVPFKIWDPEEFESISFKKNTGWGLVSGVLILVTLLNLFLFFTMKDKVYLFYSLYVFFSLAFQVIGEGFGISLFFGDSVLLNDISRPLTSLFSLIFMLKFTEYFFGERDKHKRFVRVNKYFIGLWVCLIASAFLRVESMSIKQSLVGLMNISAISATIYVIVHAVREATRKNVYARFYLIAFAPMIFFVVAIILKNFKVLPGWSVFEYGLPFAVAFESLFLAFALAHRFKSIKDSREELLIQLNEKQNAALEALLEGQEKERQRIAKELHDGLGQLLSVTKLNLSNLEAMGGESKSLEQARLLINKSIQELRSVSHNMMPSALQNLGLKAAVQELIDQVSSSDQLDCEFHYNVQSGRFSQEWEVSVYRIVQEAINNVLKHANATHVSVQMDVSGSEIMTLLIEDNGKGFEKTSAMGNGIENIRSRTKLLKGTFELDTEPGRGTVLFFEIPIA